jgi:hypothetical protein
MGRYRARLAASRSERTLDSPGMERAPKSGDTTNIVWNVVDKSLSTLFKKSAMRARLGQSIVQTLSIALAMKVMYSPGMERGLP